MLLAERLDWKGLMITTDELSKYECKKMHFAEILYTLAGWIQHDGQFPHPTK